MRWFKRALIGLMALILLIVIAGVGVVMMLNTPSGQKFAVQQINKYGGAYVHLSGLSGGFPSALKIANLQLIDPKGVWAEAQHVELVWSPLALLRSHLIIKTLTAEIITVTRTPLYPQSTPRKSNGGGFSIPHLKIKLAQLEIGKLQLGPSITGKAMTLHVTGHADLMQLDDADLAFDASSVPDIGAYHLIGTLTPQSVALHLTVTEQAGGLITHMIDPAGQQPLTIKADVTGPRDHATLNGAMALGTAKLTMAGELGLNQAAPSADIVVQIPAIGPFAPLLGLPVDGQAELHLLTAGWEDANISAQGVLTLTKVPKGLDKLLIGQTTIDLLGRRHKDHFRLKTLTLTSPGFSVLASGVVSKTHLDLTSHATLDRVADVLPQLKGQLNLQTTLHGPLHHLAAEAKLSGEVTVPDTQSGPFLITVRADDLPNAPHGTITGTGSLAGAPLALNANFAYNPKATSRFDLSAANWKSITAAAKLELPAGAELPTGTGEMQVANLGDLSTVLGHKLGGKIDANFAYEKNQMLNLTMQAQNVSFDGTLSGLSGQISAKGRLDAIAIGINATATRLADHPALANLTALLNVPDRSVQLNALTASWQGLNAKLSAPAEVNLQPGLAIRHLDLAVAGARLRLDGTISPDLNAKAEISQLDLSLLQRFMPTQKASGNVSLTAALTGTIKAPLGQINLKARGLRYLTSASTAALPPANLNGAATLKGQSTTVDLALDAGPQARATLRGTAPFSMNQPMDLRLASQIALPVLEPFLASSQIKATGELRLEAHLTGSPQHPLGNITLMARNVRSETGIGAALPPANLDARATINGRQARLNMSLNAGPDVNLTATGDAPLVMTNNMNMTVDGRVDLRLMNPILAANGTLVHGIATTSLKLTGTPKSPRINGNLTLSDGSLLNVNSGLNLTTINATIIAADRLITLQSLSAVAGKGKITGYGTIALSGANMPVDLRLNADHATPIASDLLTETLNAALTLQGGLKTGATLAGDIDILKANINIPRSLPPSVANLPIHYEDEAPVKLAEKTVPPPPINLNLNLRAKNQIFIRGDGLFAELGGHVRISGDFSHPQPTGGFSLIRGSFSLAGKTLQFTKGSIGFNGDGFTPTLDLEATSATTNGGTATLAISGTASKPKINLSSSPTLPSDEILAQLLFSQSSENLSPFQAASLAAALAQISGVGGGFSPLDSARNILGLDQLSVDSAGKGGPSVQAGRYLAPGVYVGASQSTTGQGSKANVEINLYKGLKLQSSTGTDSAGQNSSSIGLSYQYNY